MLLLFSTLALMVCLIILGINWLDFLVTLTVHTNNQLKQKRKEGVQVQRAHIPALLPLPP